MKIGIDILGGDFAPEATVRGSILAFGELPKDTTLVLIGDENKIGAICESEKFDIHNFSIIHTIENIGMDEHPAKTFAIKPNASIPIGFNLLKEGKIDGFASAGNTGAMLVGAIQIVNAVPGLLRPCISACIPKISTESPTILLDIGINPDCKPDVLYQYAILGSLYSELLYDVKNPRVALFNIGSEEEKGNLLTKAAHQLMKDSKDFNFIGNIEGTDLFREDIDVIVCDGFVGNTIIKSAEAFYTLLMKRRIKDEFFEKFNYERYGGTPILGINAPAIIGHGISGPVAIKNMILHTAHVVSAKYTEKIKEAFE